ncbi:MAG: septum formation protein Maf [Clostridia bacterium]|nr:septum formation protein Maf [Clostridia bacterium]
MKIILASGSPRRKDLLNLVVPEFEIQVSGIDETLQEGLTPEEQVTRLAFIKAKDIFDKTNGNRIVIGSDTVVVRDGEIFGKPKSRAHAKSMIKSFLEGNRTHSILTGLSVLIYKDGEYEEHKTFDEVKVYLKDISDDEIDRWIDTGNAMDKAGAYGIQNEFCVHVEKIEGNYSTMIGLPTHILYDIIKPYILN